MKSKIKNRKSTVLRQRSGHVGFTLIELLVVITIIVVLLALLTPALDRAIYQTELTVCAANQKAAAGAILLYAMDHQRAFPPRQGLSSGGFADEGWQPQTLQRGGLDDRPFIRDYVSLNHHLNCPLTQKLNIEGAVDDSWILTAYAMWWNWRFAHDAQKKQMSRIGKTFSWSDALGDFEFDVLISDHDMIYETNGWGHGTHPDREKGLWSQQHFENAPTVGWPHAPGAPPDVILSLTRWSGTPGLGADRGPYDMNFAYQDGAVLRYADVPWDAKRSDDRMAGVPYSSGFPNIDPLPLWVHLPKR